ncbi:unnamed protein product [Bemisia tabaci]|uniref:Uncharacterized protein n=1 Tax=Bemisia tabaci TaxID=7038 RepID=A0A9P0A0J7_BEMTA|nr:unnamed protein product [Bemisia tabaci]
MSPDLRNELLNDHLWEKLDEVLEIVRPIEEWLFNVQSNDMPFNQFLIAFKDISSKISAVLEKSDFLEDDEKETIRQILTDRKKKALKPIHCAAALLDPSLCNTLTPDEQSEAVDYLSTILIDLNLDLTKVLEEYANYSAKQGIFAKDHLGKRWIFNHMCGGKLSSVHLSLVKLRSKFCVCL